MPVFLHSHNYHKFFCYKTSGKSWLGNTLHRSESCLALLCARGQITEIFCPSLSCLVSKDSNVIYLRALLHWWLSINPLQFSLVVFLIKIILSCHAKICKRLYISFSLLISQNIAQYLSQSLAIHNYSLMDG